MKTKLIQGGGSSFCEAIINSSNDKKFTIDFSDKNTLFKLSVNDNIDKPITDAIIVFPTDSVNRMFINFENDFKENIVFKFNKYRKSIKGFINRIFKNKKCHEWSIGNYFLSGVYHDNKCKKVFNNHSICLSIKSDRMTFSDVLNLAKEFHNDNKNESLLIKDNIYNQVYILMKR